MTEHINYDAAPDRFFGDHKIGRLRKRVLELLEDHERDGAIPTSVRFLFYELVQARVLSKERTGARRADQDLIDAVFDLREQEVIPWDWIADETRTLHDYTGRESVKDWLLDISLHAAKIDPWRGDIPLSLNESRSLAGVFDAACQQYRIQVAATNGQVGGFLRTEVIPILRPNHRVLYAGDLDLSGGYIEQNTRAVLERAVGPLRWERIALTGAQVDEHSLRHLAITKTDRRFKNGGGTHEAIETEALSQRVLVDILRARLDKLLPQPLARVHKRERRQRNEVHRLLNGGA
jgi:hypothetical protein